MLKSGKESRRQILGVLSVARAERLLTEWANTDLTALMPGPFADANLVARAQRLFRRYPEIVPVGEVRNHPYHRPPLHKIMVMASNVGLLLREAWNAPDLRHFEWYTWKAQAAHNLVPFPPTEAFKFVEDWKPPPTTTPVEAAIFYLRQNRRRALHCPNPECPAPYFFATKKAQKYCSPECAKPAQRESKRKWWKENRAKS